MRGVSGYRVSGTLEASGGDALVAVARHGQHRSHDSEEGESGEDKQFDVHELITAEHTL